MQLDPSRENWPSFSFHLYRTDSVNHCCIFVVWNDHLFSILLNTLISKKWKPNHWLIINPNPETKKNPAYHKPSSLKKVTFHKNSMHIFCSQISTNYTTARAPNLQPRRHRQLHLNESQMVSTRLSKPMFE